MPGGWVGGGSFEGAVPHSGSGPQKSKAVVCRARQEVKDAETVTSAFLEEKTGEQPVCLNLGITSGLWIPQWALVPGTKPLWAEFAYHSIYKVQSGVKPPK